MGELKQALPQLDTFVTLSPIPGFNKWHASVSFDHELDDDNIQPLAAHYLLNERSSRGGPLDPVARFHLGNGAQIHAVHSNADRTEKGHSQSSGAMVNYIYDLSMIEKNHEAFVRGEAFSASKSVHTAANAAKSLLTTENTP